MDLDLSSASSGGGLLARVHGLEQSSTCTQPAHSAVPWPPPQGWRYLKAAREEQRYKEGALLLAQAALRRVEDPVGWEGRPVPLAPATPLAPLMLPPPAS